MLDPTARHLYIDALRPPEKYRLDRAIGTTFSLNLLTLLTVPLSLAMFECGQVDQALQDPLELLEALRRTADKISVFCQRGQISIPPSEQLLYSHLEPIVIEVALQRKAAVFHPKIWLLRFVSSDESVRYRLLCLSRNLTFDQSWDTMLALEGQVQPRKIGYGRNRPLSDFIAHLPKLAYSPVSERVSQDVKLLSTEVRRVLFHPPPQFSDKIAFRPIGIPGYRKFPIPERVDRLLVISPFLKNGPLTNLANTQGDHILISRTDEIDELSDNVRERFCEILVMEDSTVTSIDTEKDEPTADEAESGKEKTSNLEEIGLSGLHAKLFLMETGAQVRLWTGSANATKAAFYNHNVEFMVELCGKRREVGIDKILGSDEKQVTFRELLQPYRPPKDSTADNSEQQRLEKAIEDARQELAAKRLRLSVHQAEGHPLYELTLETMDTSQPLQENVEGQCWPITLQRGYAQDLRLLLNAGRVTFADISPVALTSFIAFELVAKLGEEKHSVRFVLNLPIDGLPEDRNDHILYNILSDRSRFLRYLMLLLSDDDSDPFGLGVPGRSLSSGKNRWGKSLLGVSDLMERLVRAYSRSPEKLDRVAKLVKDVQKLPAGNSLFPEGFEELWQVIWNARLEELE